MGLWGLNIKCCLFSGGKYHAEVEIYFPRSWTWDLKITCSKRTSHLQNLSFWGIPYLINQGGVHWRSWRLLLVSFQVEAGWAATGPKNVKFAGPSLGLSAKTIIFQGRAVEDRGGVLAISLLIYIVIWRCLWSIYRQVFVFAVLTKIP